MNLIPLHNGRQGVRTLIPIQICEAQLGSASSETSFSERGASSKPDPTVSAVDDSCLDFISSTATLDRFHESIDPAGWRLEAYRRNPVFQNAHNYGDILFTLGKALITEVRPALREAHNKLSTRRSQPSTCLFQRIQFATDVNPVARIAHGLYKGGFLNAVSVGFIPIRWQDADNGSRQNPGSASDRPRRKYLEQELLEVSAVAIPANPEALALALKSGAVTKADVREALDLLRSLTVDYGPWRPPRPLGNLAGESRAQFSITGFQLLRFARELRRIVRRA